jgi:hypothetical protein
MCERHEQSEGQGRGYGYGRRGSRGFGGGFGPGRPGRGFPPREEWLERLQAYRQHLEEELRNVQELIERLGPPSPQQTANL